MMYIPQDEMRSVRRSSLQTRAGIHCLMNIQRMSLGVSAASYGFMEISRRSATFVHLWIFCWVVICSPAAGIGILLKHSNGRADPLSRFKSEMWAKIAEEMAVPW